jgi:hypothetical protein
MRCLKCLSIRCRVVFDLELVISPSIIRVCSGGISLDVTFGCVACIYFWKIAAWMEFRSLFVGHA